MSNKLYEESDIQGIANAIRSKNGSSDTYTVSQMAQAITDIPSGGGSDEKDVFFYDYDGTVLYSYKKSDFLALSSMPANPTHSGLTAQGWNWTLSDAKTYVTTYDKLNIGQMYITDDGDTRIYITLDNYLKPYLRNRY